MSVASSSPNRSRCPACGAAMSSEALFCAACGARFDADWAEELRNVSYLLSELEHWAAQGIVATEKAAALRRKYELRRDELRAQLAANNSQADSSSRPLNFPEEVAVPAQTADARSSATMMEKARTRAHAISRREFAPRAPRRSLFEMLADPHTLRLLLYAGAAMLVVGIVIWLRDALYLKLREPLVQAGLLALGTIAVTIGGWLLTLRTRLRLTGRALTLIGSMLVPVNFWFLARSGLISNNGRAWVVCALCAALYAHTAALLRERLYVYLAAAASVGVVWALTFRALPEAYGLYALGLTMASLVFLHLSRLFPIITTQETTTKAEAAQPTARNNPSDNEAPQRLAWSGELWGPPLVHAALFGAVTSALLYMLLRPGFSPSPDAGIFRWYSFNYDAGIAMLLFAAGAYSAWFTARYVYTNWRGGLYMTGALALVWTEVLLLDGLRASGQVYFFALAATALAAALTARRLTEAALAGALLRAADITLTLLLWTASCVALLIHLTPAVSLAGWRTPVLFVLAATVVHGAWRGWREQSAYGVGLASLAALVFVASVLDALQAAGLFPAAGPIAAGVICAAFVWHRAVGLWLSAEVKTVADKRPERAPWRVNRPLLSVVRLVTDAAVLACALLWLLRTLSYPNDGGWGAVFVMLLALLYWMERAARGRRAALVYLSSGQAGALLLSLLVAVNLEERWFGCAFTLILFPALFALSRSRQNANWLTTATGRAASVVAALLSLALFWQAAPVLQTGSERLLAPSLSAGALASATLLASLFSAGRERARYFRLGLGAGVAAFVLLVLRAGYDPVTDVELYTTPVGVALLIIAALAVRREWDQYAGDADRLLWAGSLLLCGPLLLRALQFRLLLDLAAPWRDLGVLCAALLLMLLGAAGRLRAPVIVGTIVLLLELAVLALTSVEWLQVPLRTYLITVGVAFLIVWGVFEYRREQLLAMRLRLQRRSAQARERFGQWR